MLFLKYKLNNNNDVIMRNDLLLLLFRYNLIKKLKNNHYRKNKYKIIMINNY